MMAVRQWSVRHARGLEIFYNFFERIVVALHPVWNFIGYDRLERPVAAVEKLVKGFLFDCQMCGQCMLSSSGMSCPMNCPKSLRNGPCGGVRTDGGCEVKPDMRCVWLEAWDGSQRMKAGRLAINIIQAPVDNRYLKKSSWLIIARQKNGVEE